MADMFDTETRSRIMQSVRTAATEPEERLAIALRGLRLRFRRNDPGVFGKPDFAFRQARLAVFVDGDFWHGRAWFENGAAPATNAEFWIGKFERNRRRDCLVDRNLRRSGWSVLRLWASSIRKAPAASGAKVCARLRRLARMGRPFPSRDSARAARHESSRAG
jgi:DNA mismatch endonuclease (patch repair protein)